MKYSFIIPVFNRPDEVDELLDSLTRQAFTDFEVIIVEDGSDKPCKDICDKYADRLDLKYFMKENSGPGQSRNYGVERAAGEYVIILDSDVVLPEGYLLAVDAELINHPCDAFGGPDRAHDSFTPTQKAISYSMTSFYTTGGIRVLSIWASAAIYISSSVASPKCASAKTSTFPSASSKRDATAGSFPKPGCGISAVQTSVNSGDRYSTVVSHVSISTKNILNRLKSSTCYQWYSPSGSSSCYSSACLA